MQRRVLRLIFKCRRHPSEELLSSAGILSVYELYVHELVKFVLKSVFGLHKSRYLNYLYTRRDEPPVPTRSFTYGSFVTPKPRPLKMKHSLVYTGSLLLNFLALGRIDLTGNSCAKMDGYYNALKKSLELVQRENFAKILFELWCQGPDFWALLDWPLGHIWVPSSYMRFFSI